MNGRPHAFFSLGVARALLSPVLETADKSILLVEYAHSSRVRGVPYSNGMPHPARARDALVRLGHQNIYILTDGLKGLIERCPKPVPLHDEMVPACVAGRIGAWRRFFQYPNKS